MQHPARYRGRVHGADDRAWAAEFPGNTSVECRLVAPAAGFARGRFRLVGGAGKLKLLACIVPRPIARCGGDVGRNSVERSRPACRGQRVVARHGLKKIGRRLVLGRRNVADFDASQFPLRGSSSEIREHGMFDAASQHAATQQ